MEKTMKLWIDDFRDAPDDSWTEVRKVQPAIAFLAQFGLQVTEISLDHDIENRPDDETFMPVAYFIGVAYGRSGQGPKIRIHSDNPVGAQGMQMVLRDMGIPDVPWEPFTSNADFKKKFGLE